MIRHTIFGDHDLTQMGIGLLKALEPPEGYWLGFSGGKDSMALLKLAQLSGVKFDAHYSMTTIDPPEVVDFVRNVPGVTMDRPPKSFFRLLIDRGFPLRQSRWCCQQLKETGGQGRVVLTGVRKAESNRRAGRKQVEVCARGQSKRFVHPILDWTDTEVWEFNREHNLPRCKLYAEGFTRIGCVVCPMQSAHVRRMELARWPVFDRAFRVAFRKLYALRKSQGNPSVNRWPSGDAMFDWWISDTPAPKDTGQSAFAFD